MKSKILTTTDIESLGFMFIGLEGNGTAVYINESNNSKDEKIYLGEILDGVRRIIIENSCTTIIFMGWVKSKKSLKKLLTIVGVGFN